MEPKKSLRLWWSQSNSQFQMTAVPSPSSRFRPTNINPGSILRMERTCYLSQCISLIIKTKKAARAIVISLHAKTTAQFSILEQALQTRVPRWPMMSTLVGSSTSPSSLAKLHPHSGESILPRQCLEDLLSSNLISCSHQLDLTLTRKTLSMAAMTLA